MADERPSATQLQMLRGMIEETQSDTLRYVKEREIFAEAFAHTCGHNRLEQIGLRWSAALTPNQTLLLATDRSAAAAFASVLHRSLMLYLLPGEAEMATLPKSSVLQWVAALRMGIQGVLRRRAFVSGESSGAAAFPQPNESFLQSLQPLIRETAGTFFETWPENAPALPPSRATRARIAAAI